MTPYYEQDGITIYCGDCRDVLPDVRADLLLTDPPYGIGRDGQAMSTGGHGGRKAYEFLGWDAARPDAATFTAMRAATTMQIIWGGNYFADLLPPTSRWLVWDKGQRINQSDGELAWTSMTGALRIWTLNRVALATDGAVHPTQKPLELMSWCLSFAPEAQSVLDPFMGSGTTLRAAKDSGLCAIGIEIEERYCEIAAERRPSGCRRACWISGPRGAPREPQGACVRMAGMGARLPPRAEWEPCDPEHLRGAVNGGCG